MDKIYKVLIIEDEPSWQKRFVRFLKNEPLSFAWAANAQEADELIEKQTFDLTILDVNLTNVPGSISGLYIGEKLWQINRHMPIIIVSGSEQALQNLQATAFTFAPRYVFSKRDFDKQEFITSIRTALDYGPGDETSG